MPKKVNFARINRRLRPGAEIPIEARPLADDFAELVQARNTRADEEKRTWVVSDLSLDPSGEFATGLLGLLDEEWRRQFDEASFSLLKGDREKVGGGSEKAITPFAVDLRRGRRWVCFAKAPRVSVSRFTYGLSSALNEGVAELQLWPQPWDVDPVNSQMSVRYWLKQNPHVSKFRRTVLKTNPGRDLDDDRAEMQGLNARRKTEEFAPPPNENLRLLDMDGEIRDVVEHLIRGIDGGHLRVYLEARGEGGRTRKYNSQQRADEATIPDFGDDFEYGMDLVLGAVQEYSATHEGVDDPDDLPDRVDQENDKDA